jgi:AcrR family transcriptional regulator
LLTIRPIAAATISPATTSIRFGLVRHHPVIASASHLDVASVNIPEDVATVNIVCHSGGVTKVAAKKSAPKDQPRGYHHGDLRRSLLLTAVELASEGGPEAVTLREASRRLGVSHNAAYRHYADRDALVDAVAGYGFEMLAKAVLVQIAKIPPGDAGPAALARLLALGRGYVGYAIRNPGIYRTMFSTKTAVPQPPVDGSEAGLDPFGILVETLDDLVASGVMTPGQRPLAEFAAWAGVHGLADMFLDGPLAGLPKRDRQPIIERTLLAIGTGLVTG